MMRCGLSRQILPDTDRYARGYIDGSVVSCSPGTQVVVDVVALFEGALGRR
jgi:hypothetical protein